MFPIYYMGEWDDQNEWWIGNMVSVNPNKPRKRQLINKSGIKYYAVSKYGRERCFYF